MKICIISTLFRPLSRGGAELVAERVVDGLKAEGHEVLVISLNTYRPWNIASFQNLGKLPAFIRPLWHVLDMFNIHTFFKIKSILKKEKPDLVLSHNIKGLGYTVPRAVTSLRIPYAHTLHDVQLVAPSGLIMNNSNVPNSLYSSITRTLFASPTIVISPSKFLMDFYARHGFFKNSKKMVLPNPTKQNLLMVSPRTTRLGSPSELAGLNGSALLSSATPRNHARKASAVLFLGETTRLFCLHLLYVSQLHPSRGILFLVETLTKWRQPFHLTIAGTGSCENQLQEELKGDTRFTLKGYIANANLGPLYQDADCLILPSLCVENAPLTITDAFTHSLPVLASRVGGIPEMVQEGNNGFLFAPGNVQELTRCLDQMWQLKQQNALEPLRTAARAWAAQHSIENYLTTLLKELNKS